MKILSKQTQLPSFFKSLCIITTFAGGFISTDVFSEKMQMGSEAVGNDSMTSMGESSMQGGDAPQDARDTLTYSGGYEYRGMAGWEEYDEIVFSKVIFDQLEYRNNDASNTFRWDMQGWRGTDYEKLWVKFEGEEDASSSAGELELQVLYSQSITAFWDFQLGARYDTAIGSGPADDRFFAVIGLQGLAPYWFELEPALYISDDGDVSARVVSTYDLLFTQRLILQPRFEINIAANDAPAFGVGKGINDVQFDLRLRYEMRREVAPYIGFSWTKKIGNTKNLAVINGEDTNNLAFVAGVRLWF